MLSHQPKEPVSQINNAFCLSALYEVVGRLFPLTSFLCTTRNIKYSLPSIICVSTSLIFLEYCSVVGNSSFFVCRVKKILSLYHQLFVRVFVYFFILKCLHIRQNWRIIKGGLDLCLCRIGRVVYRRSILKKGTLFRRYRYRRRCYNGRTSYAKDGNKCQTKLIFFMI